MARGDEIAMGFDLGSQLFEIGQAASGFGRGQNSAPFGNHESICHLQMPKRWHSRAGAVEEGPPDLRVISGYGIVQEPGERNRCIQNETLQIRPSAIRSLTLKPRGRRAPFLIRSISSKVSCRLLSARAGMMTAASFPRRVMPIRSPSEARSTISDNFCFASNSPTVRIAFHSAST